MSILGTTPFAFITLSTTEPESCAEDHTASCSVVQVLEGCISILYCPTGYSDSKLYFFVSASQPLADNAPSA